MADIRIKDLSSASSSASDDFIAIDGTTNGTRKLNAFSPTFGGNATVTGTLTVAALVTANGGANVVTSGFTQTQTGNELRFSRNGFNYVAMDGGTSANIRFLGTTTTAGDTGILNLSNTQVAVLPTTASTSTSSGALVVGNGTSGGLGVGGNINAGGYLRSINSSAANGSTFDAFRADIGADGTLGALEVKAGGLPSATAGSRYGYILAGDAGAFRKFYVGGTASGGAQVLIPATDISTSTSSGALVVSGGVGVAGALYAANLGGTSTNNNAASGCIGEYAFATTAYASKVSLTSNTAANIVLISLTAGDWDVQFNPVFTQDTPLTTSGLLAGVSSSSATLPSSAAERAHSPSGPNGNSDISIAPPVTRISLASTTTIYGVATGIFSAGTMSAYGFIRARRVR